MKFALGKWNLSRVAAVGCALFSTHAFAVGHESSGGGNSTTGRFEEIEKVFGKDQSQMKAYLKTFVNEIANYKSQGKVSALLQDLVSNGLLEDIEQAPYIFSKKCVDDETGEEKDASTLRGVRNAPICVSLPKLAQGNPSESEIVGLMMHEHVRHFGLEDTTELGMHPVAVYTTQHFLYLQSDAKSSPATVEEVRKVMEEANRRAVAYFFSNLLMKDVFLNRYTTFGRQGLKMYSTAPDKVSLVISEVENCRDDLPLHRDGNPWAKDPAWRHDVDYATIRPGSLISVNKENEEIFLHSAVAWGGLVIQREACRFKISVENEFGKTEIPGWFSGYTGIELEIHKVELDDRRPSWTTPDQISSR